MNVNELRFRVGDRVMSAVELKASAAPSKLQPRQTMKAVTSRADAKVSLGFVVGGYPPLEIAQAKASHEQDPKQTEPFDIAVYARKHKPTKARRRPFEVERAADDCAALLKRMDWHLVTVTELLRG